MGGSSIGSDGLGRITSVPGYTYTYSAANRLQSVQQGGVTVASYAYDHRGLRRRKSTGFMGFNTTVYHYDEAGHLLAETNQVAGTVVLYVWAENSPVAQKSGSVLTYLHADHLQTPRWGTDAAGALVWRWKSDGFGEALPEEDVDGNAVNVTVNLRFPGQVYDAESGLHQNWMRDYQPGYGRYAQPDPIGLAGGPNNFLYALGDPTNLIDVRGLDVFNRSPGLVFVLLEEDKSGSEIVCLAPGEDFIGRQDAIARGGADSVFKTTDFINATVGAAGDISVSTDASSSGTVGGGLVDLGLNAIQAWRGGLIPGSEVPEHGVAFAALFERASSRESQCGCAPQ